MKLTEKILTFKSNSQYFHKEISDKKRNTLRLVDINDERFSILKSMADTKKYGFILIQETKLNGILTDKSFKRRITDITFSGDFVIISW